MARRKKPEPTPLERAKSRDLQALFEKVADEWPGVADVEEEGPGWIVLRLDAEREPEPVGRAKLWMAYNESGIPLVSVECLQGRAHVHVSPVPSAVIAVMTR
jgi:hypothetical protein